MTETSGDIWTRLGTSLVWDADALHALASRCVTVSLREALGWLDTQPAEPPGDVRAVVVSGLLTLVDVLPPEQADAALRRVLALLRWKSQHWSESALIFAVPDGRLRLSPTGDALLVGLLGGGELDLGTRLWGGAAREATGLTVTRADARGRETTVGIGYWVRRVA